MPYPPYVYPNFQQQQIPMNNQMGYFTPQMQQQLTQIQPQSQPILNGKIVENIDNVKLTDVPMDGNSYYFPKADGTEIYSKRWLANGSTEVAVFKRVTEEQEELSKSQFNFNEMENNIMEKLNSIDERFAKLEKGLTKATAVKAKEV